MKKTLLFLGMLVSTAYAQDCSQIFISEYVEGWSNNRAIEIYNPTNETVILSEYFIARFSNGSGSATEANAVQLTGSIPPHDVYVAVLDKRDPFGSGQEEPIWDSLEVRGDGFYSAVYNTSNAFYFNGNDAVMLAKGTLSGTLSEYVTYANGFQIIDIFGKIGEDPGEAWTTIAPYNNGIGVGVTMDHSLIRKSTVLKGVTADVPEFNALAEYDSIPAVITLLDQYGDTIVDQSGNPILYGNWFSLGTHDCDCIPLAVATKKQQEVTIYPNPTTDGVVYIKGTEVVREVQVVNLLGQTVSSISNHANPVLSLRLGHDRGVYILFITDVNGSVTTKRVVVK